MAGDGVGTVASLNGRNDARGDLVIDAGDLDGIADHGEQGLQGTDGLALVALLVGGHGGGCGFNRRPQANPVLRQERPRKMLPRILFACGGRIGMGQHIARRDGMALHDILAQIHDGLDLHSGIRRQAKAVAAIDDFDADGMGIDVGFAFPAAMPV